MVKCYKVFKKIRIFVTTPLSKREICGIITFVSSPMLANETEVIMRKSVLCLLAFVFTVFLSAVSVSASEIGIKLDNVVSESTIHIDFDTVAPMTIKNSTVVPLRRFCESAGLEVSWSDVEKTAYVKLNAKENSALPIEEYAYRMLSKADTKGLSLVPESVIVTMTVNDESLRLAYNYKDSEGDVVSIGKNIKTLVPATVVSSGSIVVPIRGLMEAFGLWVDWNNNIVTVSIPPFVQLTDGLTVVPVMQLPEESGSDVWYGSVDGSGVPYGAVYLGNFKITHYCICSKCSGKWGSATAWGGEVTPGYTIAVDPKVIPKLSTVYIDGYGVRFAEDCGGAIKGNKIDVAVSSHNEAIKLGVTYKDVWIMK